MQHLFTPPEQDTGENLHQWFQAFRGVRAITSASLEAYRSSQVAASLPAGGWQNPEAGDIFMPAFCGDTFNFLVESILNTEDTDPDQRAYRHAIAYLSLLYQAPTRGLMIRFLLESHPALAAGVARGASKARLLLGLIAGKIA
ncbi:hypothetical protein S7711_07168 [Stachybotrys chartarum IBT 7711]|uniref:Uncharacterized protein n=1 Tax=Stachybotrys chartarum (strain CBS 109288 / IBT 7711) TaxID=1280523 RepID=A0A084BAI7_STACB|nr:hypothetical protein S7711_07168 [Stachybotrys chartarum IBT 7711]KFA51640.1 hypothetical protein S40293_03956 [Stachybotrys chartarum IBT 40293]